VNNAELKDQTKKRLYVFVLKLIKLLDILPKDRTSNAIHSQLIRSGTSVLANFIEGQSSSSKKEFLIFMQYCLKSTNESKVWIALLRDSSRIKKDEAAWYLNELEEISKIFASTIITLKKNINKK
jgi:four helix bundle protein